MTTQAQIESINKAFLISPSEMPKLSTATTRPNYDTIQPFQRALDKNAMSIPSAQTPLGYLALTRSDTDYLTASSNIAFVPPVDPGTAPTPPTLSTGVSTTSVARRAIQVEMMPFTSQEAVRTFNAQKKEYAEFIAVQTALKNLILKNVAPEYIDAKKNPLTDFATVTPLELMTHLWDTYGSIDQASLSVNETRMKAAWMPPTPIEILFKQLNDGKLYAAKGNEGISDENLQRWAYDIINVTGLFNTPCREWRQTTSTTKTWTSFQVHFAKADLDRKNSTTAEASYTANQVQDLVHLEMQNLISQLDQSMTPEAPASDAAPFPFTTELPSSITPSIASANSALTASTIQQLITDAINQAIPVHSSKTRYPRGAQAKLKVVSSNNNRTNKRGPQPAQALVDGFPVTYCWTHGITRNLSHDSNTCKRKAEGHKDAATYNNRLAGSSATVTNPSA